MFTIEDYYFSWLTSIVYENEYERDNHLYLLKKLHETNFIYINSMDYNRLEDGICLRERYKYFFKVSDIEMNIFDSTKCSVLEMLVALSIKIEEEIMNNGSNRVGIWFNSMINNLHINVSDSEYDDHEINKALYIFLNRLYDKDGNGNIFTIENYSLDMTKQNIWMQANNWVVYTMKEELFNEKNI